MKGDNQAVTLKEDTVNQATLSETTIVSDQSADSNVERNSSKGDGVDGVEAAGVKRNIPRMISPVKDEHLSLVRGFKYVEVIHGDGAYLT